MKNKVNGYILGLNKYIFNNKQQLFAFIVFLELILVSQAFISPSPFSSLSLTGNELC